MESGKKSRGPIVLLGDSREREAHVQLGAPRRFHRSVVLEFGFEGGDD